MGATDTRPEFRPGEFILELKPELVGKANPLGLAGSVLELLAMLKRQHGAVKIETLWPVGVGVLSFARGPLANLLLKPLLKKLPQNTGTIVRALLDAAPAGIGEEVEPELAEEARLRLRVTLPPGEDLEAVLKKVAAHAGIEYVERVPYFWASRLEPKSKADLEAAFPPPVTPDGSGAFPVKPAGFWAVHAIGRPDAWDDLELSNIAILDSGCDDQHPGLQGAVDFANKESRRDEYGHGTFVAHTIAGRAAVASEELGLDPEKVSDTPAGVLPKSKVWVGNVFDPVPLDEGDGALSYSLDAGRYSLRMRQLAKRATPRLKKIQVVNLSVGGHHNSTTLRKDVEAMQKAGIIVVAAAGNKPKEQAGDMVQVVYPAAYASVISVGALGFDSSGREVWARSNDDVPADGTREMPWDVCAPGEWILSGLPMEDNGLGLKFSGWLAGTSMAAPYVTAAVAVLRSQGVPAEQILEHLGKQTDLGYRQLKCAQAKKAGKGGA